MFPTIFSADNFRDHIFQALLRHKVSLIHAVIAFCYSEDSPSPHLQKSGGKAHGFNRGMKAKKLFAIIGQ